MKKMVSVAAATVMAGMGVLAMGANANAVDVRPLSATGCTGNAGSTDGSGSVCITVKGTGLRVDSVSLSKKSNNRAWKDYAKIDFTDGSAGFQSATHSVARTVTKTVGWDPFSNAENNSKVCGYWHDFPGTKACVTIHK
ncbi:hypothetical protein ACIOWG_18830 [Streptomyces sp. NPDC087658]|uniref:hypothetical protein n=1 Tax=Streptomyces sp. NPDC087658 TaxID=3365800 RepID=UPI00382F726C